MKKKTLMEKCEECNGSGVFDRIDLDEIPCDVCDGNGEYEIVYCHACSVAGGADRAISHKPPACRLEDPPAVQSSMFGEAG